LPTCAAGFHFLLQLKESQFHIKLTQACVFQENRSQRSKYLFLSFSGSSSKIFRAGADQDYRGIFCDEICYPNSMSISGGLYRQKRSNQCHNKVPSGQIQGDGIYSIQVNLKDTVAG